MAYTYLKPQVNPPANGAEAMWLVKQMLTTAGWGVAWTGTGNAPPQAQDQPDPLFLESPSSLLALTQPGGSTRTLLFQRANDADTRNWGIYYAPGGYVASANGLAAAKPNVPNAPTPADSQAIWAPYYGGPGQTFHDNGQYRVIGAANGSAPYDFWFACIPTGGEQGVATAMLYDPMQAGTYPAADPEPLVITACYSFSYGTGRALELGGIAATGGWYDYNTDSQRWVSGWSLGNYGPWPNGAGLNPHTHKVDFEIGLVSASTYGRKGRSSLVKWRSIAAQYLAQLINFDGGNGNLICLGDFCLPWDGTEIAADL